MRMPRVRVSVRGMMLAVAIVGGLLGIAFELRRLNRLATSDGSRAAHYARIAGLSAAEAGVLTPNSRGEFFFGSDQRVLARSTRGSSVWIVSPQPGSAAWAGVNPRLMIPRTAEGWRQESLRQAKLKRKYERAARYPWLPVAPDTPEPE